MKRSKGEEMTEKVPAILMTDNGREHRHSEHLHTVRFHSIFSLLTIIQVQQVALAPHISWVPVSILSWYYYMFFTRSRWFPSCSLFSSHCSKNMPVGGLLETVSRSEGVRECV